MSNDNPFQDYKGDNESPDRYHVLSTFYREENLPMKTELSSKQIRCIGRLLFKEKWLNENIFKDKERNVYSKIISELMRDMVSHGRKGRAEAMKVLESEAENRMKVQNRLSQLLGL